ncbi:MAG: cytochrome c [Puniceicoccaceae bacterium]
MRQFFLIYFFLMVVGLSVFGLRGCQSTRPPLEVFPDMDRQSRFHEQGETNLFADGRMDRLPVAGTIPHVTPEQDTYTHLSPDTKFREDDYLVTGKLSEDTFGDGIPIEISSVSMEQGQEIYTIYCTICHGASGNGKGVVANPRYTYPTIADLLQTRIMELPDGDIYNTITNGKNTMGAYGSKIRVEDRWKVVMYLRALQRASAATVEDVPAELQGELGL